MQKCRSQGSAKVDSFAVNTQNYAVIDISGGSTGGNPIDQMTLADNNNGAFSYWSGANYMVGKWVNGALVEPPQQTGPVVTTPPYNCAVSQVVSLDSTYNRRLNSHGDVGIAAGMGSGGVEAAVIWPYGSTQQTAVIAGNNQYTAWQSCGGSPLQLPLCLNDADVLVSLAGRNTDNTTIWADDVLGNPLLWYTKGGANTCSQAPIFVDQEVDVWETEGGTLNYTVRCAPAGDYLVTFEWNLPALAVSPQYSYIVDTGGNWTELALPGGTTYPAAMNDSHDVLTSYVEDPVTGLPADNYLFDKNGNTLTFNSNGTAPGLIPALAQPHLSNIRPIWLSNRLSPPTDGSVGPVLNIVFFADCEVSPATWQYSALLLVLFSDGSTKLSDIGNTDPIGAVSFNSGSVITNNLVSINSSGVIAAIGDPGGNTGANARQDALLLLPVQLTNKADPTIRNGANGNDMPIQFLQSSTDTNIGAVAWIAGNDPNGTPVGAPRMPHLQAQLPGLQGCAVFWKLQIVFHDRHGNPHRDFDTGDPNDSSGSSTITPDSVFFPAPGSTAPNTENGWHKITDGTPWNIYNDPDWQTEVANGFFGGDAVLSVKVTTADESAVLLPQTDFNFRIAGENPTASSCEAYIESLYGGPTPNWQNVRSTGTNTAPTVPGYWFAYAIAKEETAGDGGRTWYNQFLNNGGQYHAVPGKEGHPDWNNDGSTAAPTSGSGGYGLFQLTFQPGDANYIMPRDWIWNWQSNVQQFLPIAQQKLGYTQGYLNYIKAHNASYFDPSSLTTTADITTFNFWESSVITLNNGASIIVGPKGHKRAGAWSFQSGPPAAWHFVPNNPSPGYLYKVAYKGVEGHTQ